MKLCKATAQNMAAIRRITAVTAACLLLATLSVPVLAHTSEQAFVLLLPTGIYMVSGVAAVALTVLLLAFLPAQAVTGLFRTHKLHIARYQPLAVITSLLSTALLAFAIYVGFAGPHDPLKNLMPLVFWTVWWIVLVIAQALVGDLWHYLNPWTGLYSLLRRNGEARLLTLPRKIGALPGIAGYLGFAAFLLADIAPDDPERVAAAAAAYWCYTMAAMLVFGAEDWLARGECFTILMRHIARISPFARRDGTLRVGLPGAHLVEAPAPLVTSAIFVLVILASGSFDGINETFWWLIQIDVNPLEFPGRSAVVWQNLGGLLVTNLLLLLLFAGTVWTGLRLLDETARFKEAFTRLALSMLPIALVYHFSHYLTVLLVNGQYTLAAVSDPLGTGADLLGLGTFYVTTGFFNSHDSVQMIWLSQAGAVVAGHVLSIGVAHAIAADMFGNARRATLSQVPLALFMIAYTLFGLWLLAAPRGA